MGCGIRCVVPVLLAALALAAPAPAQSPTQAPATTPSPAAAEPEALARAREAVREALAELASDAYPRRAAAQETLRSLAGLPAEAILGETDPDDPEQVARAEALLAEVRADARRAELLLRLPGEHREAVRALQARQPEVLAGFYDEDPQPVKDALDRLVSTRGPAVQPLLAWAVAHPQPAVRVAALRAAAEVSDPLPLLKDAVYDRLQRRLAEIEEEARQEIGFHLDLGPDRDRVELVTVLCRLNDSRALGDAVALLQAGPELLGFGEHELVDAVAGMRDARLVPTLMDRIERCDLTSEAGHELTVGEQAISQKPVDACIWVVVAQIGQRPVDYGLISPRLFGVGPPVRGFPDDATRGEAVQKLKEWWAEHRGEYPADPLPLEGE